MNQRELFLRHNAQTSEAPLALEIEKAKGTLLWDADGKEYIDLIAGISVANTGHRDPRVIKAIKKQLDNYLHLLVYGELVQSPQVQYAHLLASHLPSSLDSIYFTNSGAEATEGAMKLAKRVTGRPEIIAFNKSYHGSTQGALSVMGDEFWKNAYRPLLPGIKHFDYNDPLMLSQITEQTACIILETVQAENGVIAPDRGWMEALRMRCNKTGTLMILDAIQTGFGRTGTLWGYEQTGIIPDILLLGKALGGGMPMGAFIAGRELMQSLTNDPVLGHITTFGGHPVCCAAGMAAFKALLKDELMSKVNVKKDLFVNLLKHDLILDIRAEGLLIAVEFADFVTCKKIIDLAIEEGVLTDWFLFASNCMRIAPPLNISKKEIRKACAHIITACNKVSQNMPDTDSENV